MSEHEFKPIRITLSDEAFTRLEAMMEKAAFRSYSAAIEECIRAMYDIKGDIEVAIETGKKVDEERCFHAFIKIATRMERIIGKQVY